MPNVTYSFNFDSASMGDETLYTAVATGPAIPAGAVLTDARISFEVGISGWASDSTICIYRAAIDAEKGSPGCGKDYKNERNWVDATSSRVTLTSKMDFSPSDASKFDGSCTLYIKIAYDSTAKGVRGKEGTITLTYSEVSYCGPPSNPTLSASQSASSVELSWGAGSSGAANAVTGYIVTCQESTDGSTWGEVGYCGETSNTKMTVYPPETAGHYRRFGVQTMGTAGEDYYSAVVWSGSLRKVHAPIPSFTDTLTAFETPIKAQHMTELQTAANELRAYYGLTAFAFTTITAGETSLEGWSDHVAEIRTAIDEIASKAGKTHEAWIAILVNCPRADVIEQLRSVVLAL